MISQNVLIGIAGGTGSGKTLIAKRIFEQLNCNDVVILQQDAYYKDLYHLPFKEREYNNFDHPDAIDSDLLLKHCQVLLSGGNIEQPIYDFSTHTRKKEKKNIGPHKVIILEGILLFCYPELRELMDIKIFVDTDADVRFIRRFKRDLYERGRTMESIFKQYEETVRVMHYEFVEPTKRYADIIIPEGGMNDIAINIIKSTIELYL